jgi:hypothetical protein
MNGIAVADNYQARNFEPQCQLMHASRSDRIKNGDLVRATITTPGLTHPQE